MLDLTIGFTLWRGGASAPPGGSGSDGGQARYSVAAESAQRKGDFVGSARGTELLDSERLPRLDVLRV
jgi:hypothetical protein